MKRAQGKSQSMNQEGIKPPSDAKGVLDDAKEAIKGFSDSLKSIKIRWSLKIFMFSLSPKYKMRTVIKTFDNIVDYICVLLGGFLWEKLKNYL